MYPNLFGIKFLNMYGLCIGLGVIACLLFLRFACKKLNIPNKFEDFVEFNAIFSIAFGILSGMLFQSFYNYLDNPSGGFHLSGGITFIGGLIGGVVFFLGVYFLYGRKKYGAYLIRLLPIAACCILVAHGMGRMGCFCAGCCHGQVFDEPTRFAIYFPANYNNNMSIAAGWKYPTQLYEAIFLFITFGILAYLTVFKKYKYSMNLYLILYGIFRFFNEYLRGDSRGSLIPGLTPSQFWSIIMVIVGLLFYIIMPYIINKFKIDFDYNPEKEKQEQLEVANNE